MTLLAVSVVIPAYNAEKYISAAIASVLAQDRPPAEIIVIDDGSTDATAEIARSVREVTYVRQQNAGVAAALNHGVRVSQGQLIGFISADDVWEPCKLALQRELAARTNHLVFGHMQHFISPELTPEQAAGLVCPEGAMPAFSAGTLLTRRETFNAVGALDEALPVGEFVEWYGRATDMGMSTTMLDDIVSRRRVHSGNHSTKALRQKSYAPALHALIARRRAQAGGR